MRKNKKAFVFFLSIVVMIVFCLSRKIESIPEGIGLSDQEMALALLIFAVLNWLVESVPIAVTGLLTISLAPFTGLLEYTEAVALSFGDTTFMFFLGVLLLSVAFQQTNLGKWISEKIFCVFGTSVSRIVLGIMLAGMLLAMWVTEVAAAAIVFPIVMSVLEKQQERADYLVLGRAMTMAVAWGCAMGGVATPIATGANVVAVSYLKDYGGVSIGFFQWMRIGIPISFSLLAVGWWILTRKMHHIEVQGWERQNISLGKREKKLLAIFVLAIIFWICGEQIGVSSHQVALLAALALFLPGIQIVDWKNVISSISWDSIILICSGILLGELLYRYGVAESIAEFIFVKSLLQMHPFVSSAYIVLSVSLLKVLFSSNTVCGVVLIPILITLAKQTGQSSWNLVAPCVFSSALSFLLITSSPVNVIPYSARLFSQKDMLRYGSLMTFMSAVIIGFWLTVL